MNKRIRTGIIIVLAAIAVLAIGFTLLAGLVRQMITPPPAPTPEPLITEPIVVASHDIALGTLLTASDIKLVDMPIGYAPRDAVKEVDLILGKITKSQIVSGEMVLAHDLADPTNINHDLAFILGDQMVLMAFPASDLMSQISLLQRGDVIDIFASVDVEVIPEETGLEEPATGEEEPQKETRLFTFDALQRVGVTAIIVDIIEEEGDGAASAVVTAGATPQPTPIPQPSQINIQAYLLALTPQDALVLKHLVDAGSRFDLVLRNPTSTELFDLSPVMREYLIDRYQLEIKK